MSINFEKIKANTNLPIPLRDKDGNQIGEVTSLIDKGGRLNALAVMYPGTEQIEITVAVQADFETPEEAEVRRTLQSIPGSKSADYI